MRRSIDEQANHMLQKMTVDMSIDFWQTKECAKAACDEIIDFIRDNMDTETIIPLVSKKIRCVFFIVFNLCI